MQHLALKHGVGEAWAAHVSDAGSTYQIHEDRHTIEFAWYHPQSGEFMVAAEYSIRNGMCVRMVTSGGLEEELLGDGRG